MIAIIIVGLVVLALVCAASSVRILKQYERGGDVPARTRRGAAPAARA